MQNISEESRILLWELKVLIEKYVSLPSEVKRCGYCKDIVPTKYEKMLPYVYKLGYCSDWCKEKDNTKPNPHPCFNCGEEKTPYMHRTGRKAGLYTNQYPKYCKECKKLSLNNKMNKRNK